MSKEFLLHFDPRDKIIREQAAIIKQQAARIEFLEDKVEKLESQVKQLAGDWYKQYETIAELIALQLVVYIDETDWRIGKKSCYTWVFLSSMYVLFRCGVSRKQSEASRHYRDGIGESSNSN